MKKYLEKVLQQVKDGQEVEVTPIAVPATRGAWYREWHLMSLDGSRLDVADTAENVTAFGRPAASRRLCRSTEFLAASLMCK